jgi:hypothetical protein
MPVDTGRDDPGATRFVRGRDDRARGDWTADDAPRAAPRRARHAVMHRVAGRQVALRGGCADARAQSSRRWPRSRTRGADYCAWAADGPIPHEIIDPARSHGDWLPVMLLMGDSDRTIGAVHYAYTAGYLSAHDAWALIRLVGAPVITTYDDWDEYWPDVALALAFRTDSLDAVQSLRRVRDALFAPRGRRRRRAVPEGQDRLAPRISYTLRCGKCLRF